MADTEQDQPNFIEELITDSEAQLMDAKFTALRMVHQQEMFGDCVEDGDPYPCKTIQILDWKLGDPVLPAHPEEKN